MKNAFALAFTVAFAMGTAAGSDTCGEDINILEVARAIPLYNKCPSDASRSTTDFGIAQLISPECARPMRFTSVTFIFTMDDFANNTIKENVTIVFKKAVEQVESDKTYYKPGETLYATLIPDYTFSGDRTHANEYSFPVDFCMFILAISHTNNFLKLFFYDTQITVGMSLYLLESYLTRNVEDIF